MTRAGVLKTVPESTDFKPHGCAENFSDNHNPATEKSKASCMYL